jgi:hypothetical protein
MAENLIVTPGGYRPASKIHLIRTGHVLDGSGGGLRELDATGKIVNDFGPHPLRRGTPLMPDNVLRLEEALVKYPGATLEAARLVPGRAVPGLGTGWIVAGFWNASGVITSFRTSWIVPPPPTTQSGQLLYLFNGIQNGSFIYQPVLQWGTSPDGGGNYWAVASWYVDSQGGPAYKSGLTQVSPGAELTGIITLSGQSAAGFSYNCEFLGIPNSTFPVKNIPELTQCVETLECYYLTMPSDYPNTQKTAMTAIEIKTRGSDPSVTWGPGDFVTDVGQKATVVSNANPGGEVDLYYYSFKYWNWSGQTELSDRATATGPALALNGSVLGMAWQGLGQNNIWVAVSRDNGSSWTSQLELGDRSTRNVPALTVIGGKFAMAWQGLGQNNIWVATSADGLSWSSQNELGDRSTVAGPALAATGNLAVMAWLGSGQSNLWVSTSNNGINWSGQVELTDRASKYGPSLAAAPGKFVMAWCGLGQNNIWVSTSSDGIHWSAQKELTDRATSATPAVTYSAALGLFYMAWRGAGQDNIWVSSSTDGLNWTPQAELEDRATNAGPALSPVSNTLYMAWRGSGQNNIWTSKLNH